MESKMQVEELIATLKIIKRELDDLKEAVNENTKEIEELKDASN